MPFSGGSAGAHGDAMHQDDVKRDVAGGLAGLGSAGELLAPGSDLVLTRDGSDNIELVERTSGDIVARWARVGVNDYTQWLHVGAVPTEILNDAMKDAVDGVAGLDANARLVSDRIGVGSQRADHRAKVASANLRNSHDGDEFVVDLAWTKMKTMHITNGVSGVLRVKHENYNNVLNDHTYSRIYKNGVALGAIQDNSAGSTYLIRQP